MNKSVKNISHQARIVSFLLLFIMIFNSMSVFASNIDVEEDRGKKIPNRDFFIDGDFVYKDEDKTYIIDYKGKSKEVEIPEAVEVVGVGAFKDKGITSLRLNEGLVKIEDEAFSNNNISGNITLTSNIEFVGERAFADNLITSIDLTNLQNVVIESHVFQDNLIRSVVGLDELNIVPEGMFMNNLLREINLSKDLELIEKEAFLGNFLSDVEISSINAKLEKDVFSSNGKFVVVKTNSDYIKSELSQRHMYGYLINPVDITIKFLDSETGKRIKSNNKIKFNPYDNDRFVSLNQESAIVPDVIAGYKIDEELVDGRIIFTPNKDDYELNLYYEKYPGPSIEVNKEAVKNLLSNKKEGSNISEDELLNLVNVQGFGGSNSIDLLEVYPKEIINAEVKEYEITYSVVDSSGLSDEYTLILPIAIDPYKMRIADTDWVLGDFEYNGDAVIGLSKQGKLKARDIEGLGVPHMNPETMDRIKIVDFETKSGESSIDGFVRSGNLVFGDPTTITSISKNSFSLNPSNQKLKVDFEYMPNLEYIGNNAFYRAEINGSLPEMPKLRHIGDNAFRESGVGGYLPKMPALEYIGRNSFYKTEVVGFPDVLPNLKVIDDNAFKDLSTLIGELPEMPKLERIGEYAFSGSNVKGGSVELPSVRSIGYAAFYKASKLDWKIDRLPNIEYVGAAAFRNSNLKGGIPEMPKVVEIDNFAFYGAEIDGNIPDSFPQVERIGRYTFDKNNLTGKIPSMPRVKEIDDYAFSYGKFSGFRDGVYPELVAIGNHAFSYNSKMKARLPEMPKLKSIGNSAFYRTIITGFPEELLELREIGRFAFVIVDDNNYITEHKELKGPLPKMPKLERVGRSAFSQTNVTGFSSDMPNLKIVDDYAFEFVKISSFPEELPKLEYIGDNAFRRGGTGGPIPKMPRLKYIGKSAFVNNNMTGFPNEFPNLEEVGAYAFVTIDSNNVISKNTSLKGSLPKMPKIKKIGQWAFKMLSVTGEIPDMPEIELIEEDAFQGLDLNRDKVLYIDNNDAVIDESAFKKDGISSSPGSNGPIIIMTKDGEDAPDIDSSKYHIVNPYNIGFIGKNKSGEIIKNEMRVYARESGGKLTITPPSISGYWSERMTINKSDLVNGTYTHVYKTNKEVIDGLGGNKYQFKYKPVTHEGMYRVDTKVGTNLFLSTVNENDLKEGKIVLEYNELYFKDFHVEQSVGVSGIEYLDDKIIIHLRSDLPKGSEVGVTVSFELAGGGEPNRMELVSAMLFDGDMPLGYDEVRYGAIYEDPAYQSIFESSGVKDDYANMVVTEGQEYLIERSLKPSIDNLRQEFDEVIISYEVPSYTNDKGAIVSAKLNEKSKENDISWEFDSKNKTFYYKQENIKGLPELPVIVLDFENPAKTDEPIIIKSTFKASYRDMSGELQEVELEDKNRLFIYPEVRDGQILQKSIKNPHQSGRHSYFYDSPEERLTEFEWELAYNVFREVDELNLIDHSLDERMEFVAVDPNGRRVNVEFIDKKGDIIKKVNVSERYDIDEDLRDKVDKIKFTYFNLNVYDMSVKPKVITMLKDPTIKHYQQTADNEVNKFKNHMDVSALIDGGRILETGEDFAFTDVLDENKKISTKVEITSKPKDLFYGRISTGSFYLKSNGYFNRLIDSFKYTALLGPDHRLEDVVIANDLLASYEVSKTSNGWTRIDFDFKNTDVEIKDIKDRFKLFDIKTTVKDRGNKDLLIHGFLGEDLSDGDKYILYNKGDKIIEGIDASKYSYDKDAAQTGLGEYFVVQKLIVKDDYIGKSLGTKPGDKFSYRLEIDNSTDTSRTNFELIDILPFKGDFNGSAYKNELDLSKSIEVPEGFKIEYLNQADDINVEKGSIIKELSEANWKSSPDKNTKAIRVSTDVIDAYGKLVRIDIPMITNSSLGERDSKLSTYNQFAYTHDTLGFNQALSNTVKQVADIKVEPRDIKLTKVSHLMGKKDGFIEGVEFALKDLEGSLVDIQSTDKNGELIFKDVEVGSYTIDEVDTPKGYKNKDVSFSINAKDMLNVEKVLDLGEVVNDRIDEFGFSLKNVEHIGDLSNLNYSKLKDIYSRELKGGEFTITNLDTKEVVNTIISERYGKRVVLSPGKYILKQTKAPEDNGLIYKDNVLEYMFEVDKFGNLFINNGKGDSLSNKVQVNSNVIYFPNTVDYKTSTVNIEKVDESNKPLANAEFTLINVATEEKFVKTTGSTGKISFNNVMPGMYKLVETKAPKGHIGSKRVEFISVPVNESKIFSFKFINQKIKVNIHKYKVVADMINQESDARYIASNSISSTGGKFIVKKVGGYYQVREVWENNKISVNGKEFKTDANGSILSIENSMDIDQDSILDILNKTKIENHYEPDKLREEIDNYILSDSFNGVIDIDIEVKPLRGAIYVSKYLIDKNNDFSIKEGSFTNGAVYDLMVNKGKGFEKMDSKRIDNSNYVVFKDLDPNYEYKVIEASVPEGQEESEVKEIDVNLNKDNNYTVTTIFRNYIPKEAGEITIKKIDGDTNVPLEGVEFKLMDRNGISKTATTKEDGSLIFEDVEYSEAPYKLIETKTKDGYRLPKEAITITEDDIESDDVIVVKNYKMIETPDTGTLGRLPFIGLGFGLIIVAFVFKRRELI